MFRVDTPTADPVLPAQQAVGAEGFFTKGAAPGTPATIPGPDWFNIIQEELVAIVAAAGIARNKATTNQVLSAIQTLIGNYISAPNFFIDPCSRIAQGATANLSTSRQWGLVDMVQVWATGTAVNAGTITQDGVGTAGGKTPWSVKVAGATITGAGKVFFRRFLSQNEAQNMAGQNCTFSVRVFQDTGVAISGFITLNYANAANNFGAVTAIGTSAGQNVNNNASTVLSYTVAVPAGASNGIEMIVELDVGGIVTKDVYATDFCGNIGSAISNFAIPHFNSDMLNVMRFVEKSYELSTTPGSVNSNGSIVTTLNGNLPNGSGDRRMGDRFKVPKAVTPVITVYSTNTGLSGKVYDSTAAADKAVLGPCDTKYWYIQNNSGAVLNSGDSLFFQYFADARL